MTVLQLARCALAAHLWSRECWSTSQPIGWEVKWPILDLNKSGLHCVACEDSADECVSFTGIRWWMVIHWASATQPCIQALGGCIYVYYIWCKIYIHIRIHIHLHVRVYILCEVSITESEELKFEGISGDHLVQTPAQIRASYSRWFRAISCQV